MNEASYVFMGATEQEERRRTFWSLYLLDRLISCGRDRPIAIADSSCNLQLPCSEEAWSVGRHEKTLMLGHFVNWKASESTRVGTFALVIVLSSLLARCAKVMLQVDEGRHPDPPWSPQSEYASIYSDLLRLEAAVDLLRPFTEVLQQHQTTTACALQNLAHYFFARLIYYLCHCLLSHPFLLRGIVASIGLKAPAGFLPHAFTSGLHNATQLINLIETVQDSMSLANSSFSGYCCVIAGTYHALNASATNDDAARSQHLQYLRSALDHLKFLSQYYDNSGFMVCRSPNPFWSDANSIL